MATSALFYITIDGGANQTSGVDATSSAAIAFVPASIVGWLRVRWEIVDYPEGWSAPAGWSTDTDGTIYTTDIMPTGFTLPDNGELFGKWMFRLLVNEQIDRDDVVLEGLYYDDAAICLPSPSGLRDIGAREKNQFTSTTTRIKSWARDIQRNNRVIESAGAVSINTGDTTPTAIRRYPVSDNTARALRAIVVCYNSDATKRGEYEVRGFFYKTGGTLSCTGALVDCVTMINETDAGLNVTVTLDGDDAVEVNVVGLAATGITWRLSELFL